MILLAVDFASKCWSAALGDNGNLIREWCAWDFPTENKAIDSMTYLFRPESIVAVKYLLVEDLPFAVLPNLAVRDTSRMQGRLAERMLSYGQLDKLLFVQPMEWQRHFKVVRKGDAGFAAKALEMGYEPPDLVTKHKAAFNHLSGKERSDVRLRLKKLQTDFIVSYLILQWAHEVGEDAMLNSKSVQRYTR